MASSSASPIVLISHVSKDKPWVDRLRPQLDVLAAYGNVAIWDESEIQAGGDVYAEVNDKMKSANIVICLISAEYLVWIHRYEEFNALLERREAGGLHLIPFLVRPCAWKLVPWLKRVQMFPPEYKPLSTFDPAREDELCAELAITVQQILDQPPTPSVVHPAMQPKTLDHTSLAVAAFHASAKFALESTESDPTSTRQAVDEAPPRSQPSERLVLAAGLREDLERLPETGARLFGRRDELAILDAAWRSTSTHVVSIVAWGGVGKTTLVNRWLEQCRRDGYRGATRVFGWSFHSQGAKDHVVSSDLFFDTALRWFAAEGFERLSLWDKAELLATRIRQEPTLLVLDGIEPLQSNADFDRGAVRDQGLRWLLLELVRSNNGLCVVSSRLPLVDLADSTSTVKTGEVRCDGEGNAVLSATAPVLRIDLESITPDAGRALLKTEGVRGDNEELEQATRDFGCHALAISLLAAWLRETPSHHVSQRRQIPELDESDVGQSSVRRMLIAFEQLLAGTRELELLRIMGLFDRPALLELVGAVLEGESIPGLTAHFSTDRAVELVASIQRLRDLRLLAPHNRHRPAEIDCHPLIREYFAARLENDVVAFGSDLSGNAPETDARRSAVETTDLAFGAREAHHRLFARLRDTAPRFPDSLRDMMPLYQAVQHGCKAGQHFEAFVTVYHKRIQRGILAFATRRLGAFSTEVAALSCFFERCWDQPSGKLVPQQQAHLLNEAGMDLRALGRTEQALEPLRAALVMRSQQGDWLNASAVAGNISELQLVLGNLHQSREFARKGVGFADRSGNATQRVNQLATLADALHYSHEIDAAELTFTEAEVLRKSADPQRGLLVSVPGYRFCDLRLSVVVDIMRSSRFSMVTRQLINECERVHRRASKTLSWVDHGESVLDEALDRLTLGRASLVLSALRQSRDLDESLAYAKAAVDLLRHASILEFLVRGLLLRAEVFRIHERNDDAARDLREAAMIARSGAMRLSEVDIALEYVRWHLSVGDQSSAVGCWNDADERINDLNYSRRRDELTYLQRLIQDHGK